MSRSPRFRIGVLTFAVATFALALLPTPVQAQGEKPAVSLNWIPEDAAFYSVSLRNKEQLDALFSSKAWAKLKSMKSVQMGLQMLEAQWQDPSGPLAPAKSILAAPENQELLDLVRDMISDEFFVYGSHDWVPATELLVQLYGAVQYGPLFAQASGEAVGPADQEKLVARLALDVLVANMDKIEIPDLVIAFHITDKERALRQLKRLEPLAAMAMKEVPELKGRFKRSKAAGGQFLTLLLDAEMIPWDKIDFSEFEREEGDYDEVKAKLMGLKLQIHLGVLNDFLILAVSDSAAHLKTLTAGEGALLWDRTELKALRETAEKRLIAAGYTSQALRNAVATSERDIDTLVALAQQFLPVVGVDLPDELKARILKDVEGLAEDIKSVIPKVGASLNFSYLVEGGTESMSYDWTEDFSRDSSKPLGLLEHVGGSPILAAVARSKHNPEGYDTLVKYIKLGFGYFEDFAVPQMNPASREQYEQVKEKVMPLVKRLDSVTREKLIPSLADSQMGLVLDAKIKSKQWIAQMPPLDEAMPMLEIAILWGVSDAKLLAEAFGDYREILNEGLVLLHEVSEGNVPEIQIPAPQSKEVSGGTIYWYPLPEELGLDEQIMPNGALGETVAAISSSPVTSARLLAPTPLKLHGALAESERPISSAVHFDFPALLDGVVPWVQFGVRMGMSEAGPEAEQQIDFVLGEIATGVEILKCFRGGSSITYLEDGAVVTRATSHFQDLE